MKTPIFMICIVLLVMLGCREDPYLMFGDDARLYMVSNDSSYSFIGQEESVKTKEGFIEVCATGGPRDFDRPIRLIQAMGDTLTAGKARAVPGIHFLALDAPEMEGRLVMKAGQVKAVIPITFFRDRTLFEKEYILQLALQGNETFALLESEKLTRVLTVSEIYVKPSSWESPRRWGEWSVRKHAFMASVLGVNIDETWISNLVLNAPLRQAYQRILINALEEYNNNEENIKAGMAPMRENQNDPNSALIVFTIN